MKLLRGKSRRGGAVIESAVCLPVMFLMVLGSIECSSMVFLKQALSVASYEGARAAVASDSTNTKVLTQSQNILAARHVNGATITLSPSDVRLVTSGTRITVSTSAPSTPNSFFPYMFFNGKTITATCTMVKE